MKLLKIIPVLFILGFAGANTQQLILYNDSLTQNYWTAEYSWNTDYNLYSTDIFWEGNKSIGIQYRQGFAGFSLFTANLNTAGYDTLVFYVNGGSGGGQSFQVKVSYDGKNYNQGADASKYVLIEANKWKQVKLALKDFGADNKFIEMLAFQENKGNAPSKFYIDNIYLTSIEGTPRITDTYLSSYNPYPGEIVTVKAKIAEGTNGGAIKNVTIDLSEMGMNNSVELFDDGSHLDEVAGDGIFGTSFRVNENVYRKEYRVMINVESVQGKKNSAKIWIGAMSKLSKDLVPGLPSYLSIGTATTTSDLLWQTNNGGNCWDLGYQYITWEWWKWYSAFVERFCNNATKRGYIPVIPIYQFQPAADKFGCTGSEYEKIYCAINDSQIMNEFWTRFIQMCQEAYKSNSPKVIFHFEPDMLGYLQKRAANESKTPATLTAISGDANYPNTLAGMMKRVADLIHIYCPGKGLFANHISLWSNEISLKDAREVSLNIDSLAKKTADFLIQTTDKADLFFIDWSDMDAGYDGVWWNKKNTSLPNFARPILFANCIASYTNKKIVLWQVPCGNEKQNNTDDHYADNRLDYCFDNMKDLAKSGVVSVLFGAAKLKMTSQETDGGNLFFRAVDYCNKGKIELDKLDSSVTIIPKDFEFDQNYPNPFISFTYLSFKLPVSFQPGSNAELYSDQASLKIYNSLGQLVAVLFDEVKTSGSYRSIKFSPQKYGLPSGVYIAELKFGNKSKAIKMMYLK